MKTIILDFGGGDSTENSTRKIYTMIDKLYEIDTRINKIIIKFQLWNENNKIVSSKLKPLNRIIFTHAYDYAREAGYQVTSSVFDQESKDFLSLFDIPFVKIACIPELYNLIDKNHKYIVSVDNWYNAKKLKEQGATVLYCIRKYPAQYLDYIRLIESLPDCDILDPSIEGISDHTIGFSIYNMYNPRIYEKHIVLEHNKTIDIYGDEFATDFEELKEIL